jgi:hypothetical protein
MVDETVGKTNEKNTGRSTGSKRNGKKTLVGFWEKKNRKQNESKRQNKQTNYFHRHCIFIDTVTYARLAVCNQLIAIDWFFPKWFLVDPK